MDQVTYRGSYQRRRRARAFSLLELMAVMAIVLVVLTFSMPLLSSVTRGSNLNRGGQMVSDQFSLARQMAVTLNKDVEVRFYKFDKDGKPLWGALQLFQVDQTPTGSVARPCSRTLYLPLGVALTERDGLSPLITSSPFSGTSILAPHGQVDYRAFRFRANGSIDAKGTSKNYVTLANPVDTATPPRNFYALQINPVTGKVSLFRP